MVITVLQADVYTDSSGGCAAFIANVDDKTDKTVEFRNVSYHLPAWSVSILPDCKNVVFNTAKVGYLCFLFERQLSKTEIMAKITVISNIMTPFSTMEVIMLVSYFLLTLIIINLIIKG